jgi:hypothetical protein
MQEKSDEGRFADFTSSQCNLCVHDASCDEENASGNEYAQR